MNFSGHRKKKSSASSTSSSISSAYIKSILEKTKSHQHCKATSKNYLGIWRKFNEFLIKLDHKPESWEERVAWYGAHLIASGLQSSTLKSYVSAIKKTLLIDGYEWSDEKLKLSLLFTACKEINDTAPTRLPIQNGLLELILFELQRYFSNRNQPYHEIMYRCLFLLAYYGLFRIGELTSGNHPILAKDVHLAKNKQKMLFVLRSSKMHGKAVRPQRVEIQGNVNLDGSYDNYYCPYMVTREFLSVRGDYRYEEEPLFVFNNGTLVTPNMARRVLKKLIRMANLDPMLYDTHSFRAGRATDLQKAGFSVDQIKKLGRWRSNAVYNYLF